MPSEITYQGATVHGTDRWYIKYLTNQIHPGTIIRTIRELPDPENYCRHLLQYFMNFSAGTPIC